MEWVGRSMNVEIDIDLYFVRFIYLFVYLFVTRTDLNVPQVAMK